LPPVPDAVLDELRAAQDLALLDPIAERAVAVG